jgi:hypothetical protein
MRTVYRLQPDCTVIPDSLSAGVIGARAVRVSAAVTLPLFGATLFLSAFLMFLVEPMVGKMLLPVLGGTPMVWNTCVVFFQTMLLAGYGYAYGASRWLDAIRHRPIHVLVVALPLTMLPFATRAAWTPPSDYPLGWLLVALVTAIGFPFFALATTASVLQHWFSRTDHAAAGDPYFLYVASNAGSLLALAAYPALVEPLLPLDIQSRWWTIGYSIFAVLTCLCAIAIRWHAASDGVPAVAKADVLASGRVRSITTRTRARWIALAFVPASLMLGVTTYLSTDIAAVPLMWVVPLSIYLLTFVLAFSGIGRRAGAIAGRLAPMLLVTLAGCIVSQTRAPLSLVIPLHLATFAALGLRCHAALADDRPPASHLTEFYFWIALGGMLGGLFNTLIAPVIFSSVMEYPLALVLACALGAGAVNASRRHPVIDTLVVFATVATLTATTSLLLERSGAGRAAVLAALGFLSIVVFTQRRQSLRFAASVAGLLVAGVLLSALDQPVLHAERTFYGVHRVVEDKNGKFIGLAHGTTLHGMQSLDPASRHEPLTYFHRTGPFGQAFNAVPAMSAAHDVAVIGLGAGTLAAYARRPQRWTFFEIDPAVERIARQSGYFSYLNDCSSSCRVVLGDARLSIQRVRDTYDVIVLDAFSSDAIPMHLITSEAVSLYLSHLNPWGMLIFHISNQHLLLGPVVARLAASHNLVALEQVDLMTDQPQPVGKSPSHWVVMTRPAGDLGSLVRDPRWRTPHASADTPLWTDDFSNILSVLRLR